MKTLSSTRKKLVVELTSEDIDQISCLFSLISADNNVPTPWWATEDSSGEPQMNEEKFEQLWANWSALTNTPEASEYFEGEK